MAIQNLKVEVGPEDSKHLKNVQAFECGSDDKKTFYYGQGPHENQIAVYTLKKDGGTIAEPFGIMQSRPINVSNISE